MSRTAIGLGERGHDVWIIAHPDGRFIQSASQKLKIISAKLGMDYNPLMIFFIRNFIKKHGIDLMVTNIEKEVMVGGLAGRLAGIPNIRRVGREDDFNERLRVRWHQNLLVDRCIVPCNLIRDNALKRASWLDASSFTTIYNGRNPIVYPENKILERRKEWGLSRSDSVIGVTTQLLKIKGLDMLIRVFAAILKRYPDCYLVITGEGAERQNLQLLAKELMISTKVIFGGFSSDPLLSAASYDIAVSNSQFEGFPNTVVEYLAAGRPVVTTDAGGVPEMVRHMCNGWLIPCGNEKKMYEGILSLLENPDLRDKLSRGALKTIKEKFSEDMMMFNLEAFFKEMINRHKTTVR